MQNAYRIDASTIGEGSTLAEYAYDAQGRRIKKSVYLGGVLDNVEDYYYTGWSVVETRNGSDQVTQQYVWDNLAGHYIDSLVMVANNTNPTVDNVAEQELYVLQDQQFNVLAITDGSGDIIERYEYTLYGERTIMNADYAVLGSSAYTMNMGFQGLFHDTETGLVYNRNRMLNITTGRFIQRDPLGYPDGMNTYAAYHVMGGTLDPMGLVTYALNAVIPKRPDDKSIVAHGSFAPNAADRTIHSDHVAMARLANRQGFTEGARFLRHYLGNSGTDLTISTANLIRDSKAAHREYYRELNQAMAFVESQKLNPHTSIQFAGTNWDSHTINHTDSIDWWLAFRGYNDSGEGVATCTEKGKYKMEYTYHVSKYYNFDPGDIFLDAGKISRALEVALKIAGYQTVWTANRGARLQNVGLAQDFHGVGTRTVTITWSKGKQFDPNTGKLK